MKNTNYLLSAQEILSAYEFPEPFHLYLKNHFKLHKKYGSRDRKLISALLYGYFKIGQQSKLDALEAMKIGAFLSAELSEKLYLQFFEFGATEYLKPYEQKIIWLQSQNITIEKTIFPELSNPILSTNYEQDILQTHHTFIRVRKNKEEIEKLLKNASIVYECIDDNIISIANNINLKEILPNQQNYVVQDANSAMVTKHFKAKANDQVWDCCAASGGKSIAMYDVCNKIKLFVSDVRLPILENLKNRFKHYDIKNFEVFPHNAQVKSDWVNNNIKPNSFDTIICDAPCTGSGTWSRAPEQFYFLPNLDIEFYTQRQQNILQNTWHFLKKGGTLYYITCSVFAVENENIINNFIAENKDANIILQKMFIGFDIKADSLFLCELKKN